MLKVMSIVGTRPELIKMSRVITELDRHTQHVLVHTGQNFDCELNRMLFDDLEIREPDYLLDVSAENAAQMIAKVIARSDEVLEKEQPEAVLIYGDTNSGLAVIAAKRRKIPVFHMEAGNRCFDQRVPEELNRKIIDHLSDINLVISEHARRYLIAEGIKPETIIKTGSHMQEVLDYYAPKIAKSDVLQRLELEAGRYFIVSAHREENVDTPANLMDLVETLNALAEGYDYPVVVSTHPRTRKRLDALQPGEINQRVRFVKPLGFCDYIKLQINAFCVLSDSGTISEEASLLDLPAVTLRNVHERPEGMDSGTLVMSGLKKAPVLEAVKLVVSQRNGAERVAPLVEDYAGGQVSRQVLRVVMSYVEYVNRTVWSKQG
ncbi:MAG: non-hydrolyzing UDP-N-acetylglucosamine 2-epimerase [Thiohalobacterales bacterium]